jgi:hypothetical protein
VCVCVKTRVPHFGAGRRSRPWVVALLLLKIFLAKKVDNGARGRHESVHRKPNFTQEFFILKNSRYCRNSIFPFAERLLNKRSEGVGVYSPKRNFRNPDQRKSQLVFAYEPLCEDLPLLFTAASPGILPTLSAILPSLRCTKQSTTQSMAVESSAPVEHSPPSLRGCFGRASCRVEFVLSGT